MNSIYLFLLLLVCTLSFGQKLQLGYVHNQNDPIEGVDVLNFNTKNQTQTNQKGEFTISINLRDTLFFYKKDHNPIQFVITSEKYNLLYLQISLKQITVELDEVIVTQLKAPEFKTEDLMNIQSVDDSKTSPTNNLMYNANQGGNVFGLIYKLISLIVPKKSAEYQKKSNRTLRESIVLNLGNDFLTQKLQLQPEEIESFIRYCEFDDITPQLIEDNQALKLIEFLTEKHLEFNKVNR